MSRPGREVASGTATPSATVPTARPRGLLGPTSAPSRLKVGLVLWAQGASWADLRDSACRADAVGLDSIWTWDHLRPLTGPAHAPIFEGWTTIAGLGAITTRPSVGLMVGAAPLRQAELVAKAAITVDHLSGGRCILGLGAGSRPAEYGTAAGHASPRERIAILETRVAEVRARLGREPRGTADQPNVEVGPVVHPGPFPGGLGIPILIGGSGRQLTIPIAARFADMWNPGAPTTRLDHIAERVDLLDAACAGHGRDPAEIERTMAPTIVIRDRAAAGRKVIDAALLGQGVQAWGDDATVWLGSPQQIADRWQAYAALGFRHLLAELVPPFDAETIERLVEVRDLVARA